MARHEAVGKESEAEAFPLLRQEPEVLAAIGVGVEHRHEPHAAVSDVTWCATPGSTTRAIRATTANIAAHALECQ